MIMRSSLLIVHLSDVHFVKNQEDAFFDPDCEVRTYLEADLHKMHTTLGDADGVFITGDIAYSGKANEYADALNWMKVVCNSIGTSQERVWIVPGNHDVDRTRINDAKPLRDLRSRLRSLDATGAQRELREILQDGEYSKFVFDHISNYIKFAARFSCEISPAKPYWQSDLSIGDYKLRITGLSSVTVSDSKDNDKESKLVLGDWGSVIAEETGVIHCILCHHPPDWLIDGDSVEQLFKLRTSVQMYGHKHTQLFEVSEREGRKSLKISAGATQPSRSESEWCPRYNWINMTLVNTREGVDIKVSVYPRMWSSETREFVPDFDPEGSAVREFRIPMNSDPSLESEDDVSGPEARVSNEGQENEIESPVSPGKDMPRISAERRLAYMFLTLQYHEILNIANDLGLVEDSDEGLLDFELFQSVLMRAKRENKLPQLWDNVSRLKGEESSENPFQRKEG